MSSEHTAEKDAPAGGLCISRIHRRGSLHRARNGRRLLLDARRSPDDPEVQPVKVKVQVTLDVDAEAWAEEYGIDKAHVRADVIRWAVERLNRYDDGIARVTPPEVEQP